MKTFVPYLIIPLVAATAGWTRAAEQPGSTAPGKHGYTVMVEIKVNEKGDTDSVRLMETEDKSVGEIMSKMALAMALKTDLPAREKEGKPVKYTARVPFFFAIESDEGPAAADLPKPKVKEASMPTYPPAFRESGEVGGAVLELVVDASGTLQQLTTLRSSHPEFEHAARESINQWKFVAAEKDGQAVESRTRLAIAFETEEKMADLRWRVAPRPALGSFVVIRPNEPISDEAVGESAAAPAPAVAPRLQAEPATPPALANPAPADQK